MNTLHLLCPTVRPAWPRLTKTPALATALALGLATTFSARAQVTASLPPYALSALGASTTLGPPTVSSGTGLTYQWSLAGKPIAGATASSYATPADLAAGLYQYNVAISNNSVEVTNLAVTLVSGFSLFNTSNLWTINKDTASFVTPPYIGGNVLHLTDDQGGEGVSAFFADPGQIRLGSFTAAFTYQDVTTGGADGVSFCLQDDTRGTAALGGSGGSIGIAGVTPSVDFDFDIYPGNAPLGGNNGGFAFNTDGAGPAPYSAISPIALAGGDPINVFISYDTNSFNIDMTLVDTLTAGVFSTQLNIGDFAGALGAPNAYLGFAAGTGGAQATQVVSNFVFLYSTPFVSITSAPTNVNASVGQTVTFTASAVGSPPLTFQWKRSGSNIAGANGSSLTIPSAQLSDATTYTVTVGSENATNIATASAALSISTSVSASILPASVSIFTGLSQTLTAVASGTPPLTYQWFNGPTPIPGATGSNYVTPNNLTAGSYNFSVAVSNANSHAEPTANVTVRAANGFEQAAIQFNPISFWPLDEASGTVAYDYVGGNNGAYVNEPGVSPGQPGPNFPLFAGQTSALFNGPTGAGYIDIPRNNLDIRGSLTMFAWIQVTAVANFATFFGHSDNSYRMDIDTSGFAHFADNPAGDATGAQSLIDGNWHLVAGVYDAVSGNRTLYVDGILQATSSGASGPAGSPLDVVLGGDPQYLPSRNFNGYIADAAIYDTALTDAQIQQLYAGAGIAPTTVLPVTQFSGNLGGSVNLTADVVGTAPLALQWYYIDNTDTVHPVAGQNTATLTLDNLSVAQSGDQFFLVAGNLYGSSSNAAVLAPATLSVVSGSPTIASDIAPTTLITTIGTPVSFTFGVFGTAPITYQWYKNGQPISGATDASYSFLASGFSNTFYVIANNSAGSIQSAVATVFSSVIFDDGSGWTVTPSGTFPVTTPNVSGNAFYMTDANNSEGVSGWFSTRVPINVFQASFTFLVPNGSSPPADGMSFALQNSAVNARGGTFSISGLAPSINWDINLYPGNNGGVGIYCESNGIIGAPTPPAPIVTSTAGPWPIGDPVNVTINYDRRTGVAGETLVDTVTHGRFVTNWAVGDITKILGSSDAWVGFTAATGGLNATMIVTNFTFSTVPGLGIVNSGPGASALQWSAPASPAASNTFVLQASPAVTGPWSDVNANPAVTNGIATLAVTNSAPAEFYRLVSP